MSYRIIAGEQKTDDWQELRIGKVTGSNAKKVKGAGNAFLYETLALMTTDRDQKQAFGEHVERGNELEPEARAAYEKLKGVRVEQAAFIERDDGRVGFSPDGIIRDKKLDITRIIEIKCPDTNNHIRYVLENKIPSEHIDQIIHAFVVCDDVDRIDFVSYDPRFRFKPLLVIEAHRKSHIVDISTAQIAYSNWLTKLDESYKKLVL